MCTKILYIETLKRRSTVESPGVFSFRQTYHKEIASMYKINAYKNYHQYEFTLEVHLQFQQINLTFKVTKA